MNRATSLVAFSKIQKALPPARRRVWEWLVEHGPATGRELNKALKTQDAHKRVAELRQHGLVIEYGERICRVSGHQSIVNVPLKDPVFIPLQPKDELPAMRDAIVVALQEALLGDGWDDALLERAKRLVLTLNAAESEVAFPPQQRMDFE